ncbi:hypothetical protein EV424DRAFT_175645 [Suillus variegatus]|nr:hypothetical protein EV424DRAFT_175645 [Suillus variegatus]
MRLCLWSKLAAGSLLQLFILGQHTTLNSRAIMVALLRVHLVCDIPPYSPCSGNRHAFTPLCTSVIQTLIVRVTDTHCGRRSSLPMSATPKKLQVAVCSLPIRFRTDCSVMRFRYHSRYIYEWQG